MAAVLTITPDYGTGESGQMYIGQRIQLTAALSRGGAVSEIFAWSISGPGKLSSRSGPGVQLEATGIGEISVTCRGTGIYQVSQPTQTNPIPGVETESAESTLTITVGRFRVKISAPDGKGVDNGANIRLRASVDYPPDADNVTYAWRYLGGTGAVQLSAASGVEIHARGTKKGTATVRVRATSGGISVDARVNIEVRGDLTDTGNLSVRGLPTNMFVGQTVTLVAGLAGNTVGDEFYVWTISGPGTLDIPTDPRKRQSVWLRATGTGIIQITCRGTGQISGTPSPSVPFPSPVTITGSATISTTVGSSGVSIGTPDGTRVDFGGSVRLQATVSNFPGTKNYRWKISGGVGWGALNALTGASTVFTGTRTGRCTVQVTVTGPNNVQLVAQVTLTVLSETQPPPPGDDFAVSVVAERSLEVDTSTSYSAQLSNPPGTVAYRWEILAGGTGAGTLSSTNTAGGQFRGTRAGVVTIRVTATSGSISVSGDHTFTITDDVNPPPPVGEDAILITGLPASKELSVGQSVVLIASFSRGDVISGSERYAWRLGAGSVGKLSATSGTSVQLTATGVGNITVYVTGTATVPAQTPSDAPFPSPVALSGRGSTTARVELFAVDITAQSSLEVGAQVSYRASVRNAPAGVVSYTWRDRGGTGDGHLSSYTAQGGQFTAVAEGSFTVRVTARVGGLTAFKDHTFTITAGEPPVHRGDLTIQGLQENMYPGQELSLIAALSRADIVPGSDLYFWRIVRGPGVINQARGHTVRLRATGLGTIVLHAQGNAVVRPSGGSGVGGAPTETINEQATVFINVIAYTVGIGVENLDGSPNAGSIEFGGRCHLVATVKNPPDSVVNYRWTIIGSQGGGAGRIVTGQGTSRIQFVGERSGSVTFQVVATSGGIRATDRQTIEIGAQTSISATIAGPVLIEDTDRADYRAWVPGLPAGVSETEFEWSDRVLDDTWTHGSGSFIKQPDGRVTYVVPGYDSGGDRINYEGLIDLSVRIAVSDGRTGVGNLQIHVNQMVSTEDGLLTITGMPPCLSIGQEVALAAALSRGGIVPGSDTYIWEILEGSEKVSLDSERGSVVRLRGVESGRAVVKCSGNAVIPADQPTPEIPFPTPIPVHETGTVTAVITDFKVEINPSFGEVGFQQVLKVNAVLSNVPDEDDVAYHWRIAGSVEGGRGILREPGSASIRQEPVRTQEAYFTGLAEGLVTIEVQVTSGDCTVRSTANIRVGLDASPVIRVSSNNDRPDVGEQISLSAVVESGLGDAMVTSIAWKAAYRPLTGEVDGVFAATTGSPVGWTPGATAAGKTVVFGATVELSDGRIGTGTVVIGVEAVPVGELVLLVTTDNNNPNVGQAIRLAVQVESGLDGESVTSVDWEADYIDDPGDAEGLFTAISLTQIQWTPGAGADAKGVELTANVTLSDGRTGSASIQIHVGAGGPVTPEVIVVSVSATKLNPAVGEKVRLEATVTSGLGAASIDSVSWATAYEPVAETVDEVLTKVAVDQIDWTAGEAANERTVTFIATVVLSDARVGYGVTQLTVGASDPRDPLAPREPGPPVLSTPSVIVIPSSIIIVQQDVSVGNPGLVIHRSQYTHDEILINRGVGMWNGTAIIERTDDEVLSREIEGWLLSMIGQNSLCELPLHRQTINFQATVERVENSGGSVLTVLDRDVPELRRGHYIRSGNRTLQVTTVVRPNQIVCVPQTVLPVGAELRGTRTVRVRIESGREPGLAPRVPDWYGPWNFHWTEVV